MTLLGAGAAQADTAFPVTTIGVGNHPDAVAVDPAAHDVYVANRTDGTVSVIDESNVFGDPHFGKVTATIPASDPVALAVDPAAHDVYVANYTGTVSVIDESTNQVTGTPIHVGSVGNSPDAVAVDPATHDVYVATGGNDTVSVIDESTNQVTGTPIHVGHDPVALAVDPAAHDVYVVNSTDGTVSVIDESTNQVTGAPIPVGKTPLGVAVDPMGWWGYPMPSHNVFVDNHDDGTVSVISPEVSPTITGTPDPATVGTPYDYQFPMTGSPAPTATITSGTPLPPGLTLYADGTLTGTPTTPGTYTFTVTANNGFNPPASDSVTMIVSLPRPSPPKITGSPDDAYLRAPYSYQFTVTGFPVPTVALAPGTSLPPGLTLHADGTLTGTPTKAGTYTITVIASNSTGPDDKESFDLTVSPLHKPPPPPPCHPHLCV